MSVVARHGTASFLLFYGGGLRCAARVLCVELWGDQDVTQSFKKRVIFFSLHGSGLLWMPHNICCHDT